LGLSWSAEAVSKNLNYKGCWQAPGYRNLSIVATDDAGKEYQVHVSPKDLQRLIWECADAAKQIGTEPPIDWADYPTQVVWPQVTPWIIGQRRINRAATLPAGN
jgi:hypothetical protein